MRIINVKIVNTGIELTDNFDDRLCINLTFEGSDLSDCWSISLNRLESLLKTLNVNRYEDIKNSFARLRIEDTHIRDIGNIITDDWLSDEPYVPEDKKIQYNEPSNKDLVDNTKAPKVRCKDCKWCKEKDGDSNHYYCYMSILEGSLKLYDFYEYESCPVFVSKDSDKSEQELR